MLPRQRTPNMVDLLVEFFQSKLKKMTGTEQEAQVGTQSK
jgi:hypothetical protein